MSFPQLLRAPRCETAVEAPLLAFDRATFTADFDRRPFAVRHQLADHPLFALPRLIELAQTLSPESVEYNAGNLPVSQDPSQTPRNGLSVAETIRRIEECRSWLVLKNVENDPAYRDLLDATLADVEATRHPYTTGICKKEAFIFISSPGSVTPYHIDPECNFLLQIRGQKLIYVFDGMDRSIISEEELERFYSGAHRNLVFKDEYQAKALPFEMEAGDGVHVPVTAPHWVKNGDAVSVSFSITFKTRRTERRSEVYQVNHALRARGWSPLPFGRSDWRDTLKCATLRVQRRWQRLRGKPLADASPHTM